MIPDTQPAPIPEESPILPSVEKVEAIIEDVSKFAPELLSGLETFPDYQKRIQQLRKGASKYIGRVSRGETDPAEDLEIFSHAESSRLAELLTFAEGDISRLEEAEYIEAGYLTESAANFVLMEYSPAFVKAVQGGKWEAAIYKAKGGT